MGLWYQPNLWVSQDDLHGNPTNGPLSISVNVGGWFVLEPFITPTLYQKYPGATDEWSLSTLMAADTASGGLNQLETHYKTFLVSHSLTYVFC